MTSIQAAFALQRVTNPSITDSITGLFTHGYFHCALEQQIHRCAREGTTCTLLLIGVDSLTMYNMMYGHLKGDEALCEIGRLVASNFGHGYVAARYAGDVFAVTVVGAEDARVLSTAEALRLAVATAFNGNLTISGGLVSYPKDATNKEQIIDRAEQALMQAKTAGKNLICRYQARTLPGQRRPRILLIDDEWINREVVAAMLYPLGCDVLTVSNGKDALSLISKVEVDLILLDIVMPGMDGYEVCRRLKQSDRTRLVPVVMLTGLDEQEAKIRAIEAGADDFITKPPNETELLARSKSLIRVKALNDSLIGIENVLFSLARAVEAKDVYTQGHIARVSQLALTLWTVIGFHGKELEALRYGGILHDVGKVTVPQDVLNKQGPLSPNEWEIIKAHPSVGHSICTPLSKVLGPALDVIRHHHEKLDGTGYPDGLSGEQISIAARLMAVIDIYDALVTDRPYRKAIPQEQALLILRKEAEEGKLDKTIVKEWVTLLRSLKTNKRHPC